MKRLAITGPRQAEFEEVEMPVCALDGVVVVSRNTQDPDFNPVGTTIRWD